MTTAAKVWTEINGGHDRRGSAPCTAEAQVIIGKHGGREFGAGWRFNDRSLLQRRGTDLFAPTR